MMQRHVRYHLERLALYALPDIGEDKDDELASEKSSDSHQVIENRGRHDSIGNDFVEERQAFLDAFSTDESGRDGQSKGGALLSEANLQLTQLSSPVSWLDTYLASQHPASSGFDGSFEPYEFTLTKTMLGPGHPETLSSMENLASIYRDQGRFGEAETLQMRVVEGRKTMLGPDNPETLSSMENLASIYRDQGRFGEAETLQMRVVEGCKTMLGTDHPDTLSNMENLASIYRDQGRFGEAEKLQVQAPIR